MCATATASRRHAASFARIVQRLDNARAAWRSAYERDASDAAKATATRQFHAATNAYRRALANGAANTTASK